MNERTNMQKIRAFILAIGALCMFLMVCVPWIEKQLIPEEMRMLMEAKEINPAHLFYSESSASGEAIFDLRQEMKRHNNEN
jgi:hypothetical protein